MAIVITTYVAGSCAVSSIANVGSCKSPVQVLTEFCKNELGTLDSFRKEYGKLACFYVFCAGPEVRSDEPGGTGHSKNHWPRYGTETAQYIMDNGLGEVVTVGPKKNLKHHSTSTAQTWLWSPDQKAMERWWNRQQGF